MKVVEHLSLFIILVICHNAFGQCDLYEYTGTLQEWTVPAGVDTIRVKMWGAAGGGGPDATNNAGGGGGYTEATIPVYPGQVIQIFVGEGGKAAINQTGGVGGWPNGGDGGSGNRIESPPLGLVGGSGGGGGRSEIRIAGISYSIAGGGGGGACNRNGGAGGGDEAEYTVASNMFNLHGFGGTQTAGGAPASNTICRNPVSGTPGAALQGGNGATDLGGIFNDRTGGGGGGDGYFGGGGGSSHDGCFGVGSAGGGGSGYLCSSCPGVTGLTLTQSDFSTPGFPANESDSLLASYPNVAKGIFNGNGGNGLVQICYNSARATSTGSITASICPGDVYLFNGVNRTAAGAFLDTFTNYLGYDSVVTLNLTVLPTSTRSFNINLCPGGSYFYNGVNRTVTGTYLDTFTNYVGCDSVVTLNLFIYAPVTRTQNITICNTATIVVGSRTYSSAGTFKDTFVNYVGCDSVVTTNLTVNYPINVTLKPVICEGSSFVVGSNAYTTTGVYLDTLRTYIGCDSFVLTNLMVNPITYGAQSFVLCLGQSVSVGSNVYSNDGIYADTLVNAYGCDSVLITDIVVKRPVIFVIDTSICTGDTYDGTIYATEAHYADTIISSIGCDSFITQTNIYIIPDLSLVTSTDVTICEGTITALTAMGGNGIYTWSPDIALSCTSCSITNASPPVSTLYTVSTYGCNGNLLTGNIFVSVQPAPFIQVLSTDTCVYIGQAIQLNSIYDTTASNSQINWEAGGRVLCTDCPVFQLIPFINGYHYAIITDSVGCVSVDSFEVCVKTECPDSSLEVPNYMTPNGDGSNDRLTIRNPENIPIVFLRIFDRWGAMLYEEYSTTPSWDGRMAGDRVALPGVYVYYIESRCATSGNMVKTGNITILE